jgi:hypothetical protein
VKRLWQTFTEPWESARIQIEEFIPAPSDAVVTRQTWAWQFHDGELVRLLAFNDLNDALVAVGLSK